MDMKARVALVVMVIAISASGFVFGNNKDSETIVTNVSIMDQGISDKSSKAAKKEAKKFIKDGWEITPGSLPLEKQFDRAYSIEYEIDDEGYQKFIIGEAMSIGENYDAAKMQALELAKQAIAGKIESEVVALIENSVANKQLAKEQAASLTKSVSEGTTLISKKIGRTISLVECYRTKSNMNKEVLVRIAYNADRIKAAAKDVIIEGLEEDSEELRSKLDDILGW